MNDPNYSDWFDFYGEEKTNKNQVKSKFAKKVLLYIRLEWGVFVEKQTPEMQTKVLKFINKMKKQGLNVPNIAAEIVYDIIPL